MCIFDIGDRNMDQKDGYTAVLQTVEKSTDEISDLRNESSDMVRISNLKLLMKEPHS